MRFAPPEELWRHARAAYSSTGRYYHDERHLDEMLARVDEVDHDVGWKQPREVLLATLYHDAVYVAGRIDNEAESVRMARAAVERWLPQGGIDLARVEALVLLTARHAALTPADVDAEAALFLDCDMSILGAASERFEEYDRDVAQEYAALPREIYAAGRRRFLERLLASERIFLSEYFHARLDAQARANLRHALASG